MSGTSIESFRRKGQSIYFTSRVLPQNSSSEKSRFILQVEFFVKVEFYRNSTFLTFWGPRLYVDFHKNSRFEFVFGI
jgi:hypothetical protein